MGAGGGSGVQFRVVIIGANAEVVQQKLRRYLVSPDTRAAPNAFRSTPDPFATYVPRNSDGSVGYVSSTYCEAAIVLTKNPAAPSYLSAA